MRGGAGIVAEPKKKGGYRYPPFDSRSTRSRYGVASTTVASEITTVGVPASVDRAKPTA
jgi:hypothetical protein